MMFAHPGAFIQKHPEICTLKLVVFFSEAKNGLPFSDGNLN